MYGRSFAKSLNKKNLKSIGANCWQQGKVGTFIGCLGRLVYKPIRITLHKEDTRNEDKEDLELNKLYNKQQTTEGTYVTYKST